MGGWAVGMGRWMDGTDCDRDIATCRLHKSYLAETRVGFQDNFSACVEAISRADFPTGFIFGTASSAYQYEGAVNEGQRGPTIWDTLTRRPGRVIDFSNADVAVDHYHRYKEDVELMKDIGMDAYRFSISWSRIFPSIEPYVTLFHWDLPQALEDRYGGWLNSEIIEDFVQYAFTCFKEFGDRVKHWITFNEPYNFAIDGYDLGIQAPGRCSILSHLMLVLFMLMNKISRMNKEASLGLRLILDGMNRSQMPMKTQKQQREQWTLSLDAYRHGKKIGETAASSWLHIVPWGMFKLMKYVKEKYGNPPVVITENGMDDANHPFSRLEDVLQDDKRIQYHNDYMSNLLDAIRREGCNVHGYFVWSLLDNWEWNSGYTVRFGLYYIDYKNNLTRIPKASVQWFSQVLAQKIAII
uniref:Beta-glucosidase n=1 Tax=Oryza punctata TaxID=4537 RepID=A0A0E0LET5_ORYPU